MMVAAIISCDFVTDTLPQPRQYAKPKQNKKMENSIDEHHLAGP